MELTFIQADSLPHCLSDRMSSDRKTKTSGWEDEVEPNYTAEQKKRIQSYLKENDENCKESTTLILIIVIGLLVALSIVGFLAIRNNSSVKYKGAHTTYEHSSNRVTHHLHTTVYTHAYSVYPCTLTI